MPDQLWAPWRFDYVKSADPGRKDGCIFVELPAQASDRDNLILHRGRTAFVILNKYPYTSGHLMVAPFRHTADIADLDDAELLEIHRLIRDAMGWIQLAFNPEGFNIGLNVGSAGGAGIPSHLHWHIVPRWSGDTNFMTTVGDVRVIPQSLETTYDLLERAKNATS